MENKTDNSTNPFANVDVDTLRRLLSQIVGEGVERVYRPTVITDPFKQESSEALTELLIGLLPSAGGGEVRVELAAKRVIQVVIEDSVKRREFVGFDVRMLPSVFAYENAYRLCSSKESEVLIRQALEHIDFAVNLLVETYTLKEG